MPTKSPLSHELLKQNGLPPIELDVEAILRRDRRRLRIWLLATVVLWLFTTGYLLSLCGSYAVFIHPKLDELMFKPSAESTPSPELRAFILTGLKVMLWWPATFLAAALCTTGFIMASRRATLHLIQVNLERISEQIAALISRDRSSSTD